MIARISNTERWIRKNFRKIYMIHTTKTGIPIHLPCDGKLHHRTACSRPRRRPIYLLSRSRPINHIITVFFLMCCWICSDSHLLSSPAECSFLLSFPNIHEQYIICNYFFCFWFLVYSAFWKIKYNILHKLIQHSKKTSSTLKLEMLKQYTQNVE